MAAPTGAAATGTPGPSDPAGRAWRRWPLLLAAWAGSRGLLILIGLVPTPLYPGGPLAFDDLDVYSRWLPILSTGALPTDDMWQYPPLAGLFFLVGTVGSEPRLALLAAIVAVDLVLTVVLGRQDRRAAWWWVLFGLLIGPVLVSRFDVVPALFAVLAVLAAARPVLVGMWAAVGAALKVWPALLLAIVPRRAALSAGAAFAGTALVALGVAAVLFDHLSGFLGGQGNRGLQAESVGALPFLVANAVTGGVPLDYRYGSMEVAADGAGVAAVVVTAVAAAGLVWLAVAWWRGTFAGVAPADVAFTVVLFSVVVSRVFSPQYSIWLLALGAVCLVAPGGRLRGPVLLVAGAALCAQVLYPSGYGRLLAGDAAMVALQCLRIGLVLAAFGLSWYRVIWRPGSYDEGPMALRDDQTAPSAVRSAG